MMARHNYEAPAGAHYRRVKGIHDLGLGICRAARGGINRFRPGVEPPLSIQEDDAQFSTDVDDSRSRTPFARFDGDQPQTYRVNIELLAAGRLPPLLPIACPVVVT